ncbi:16S rRNA (cytosine(967)-C(5))-methyltransferase RsmB [Shewanella dokdonensis]|uniref:16S rRNA (cytosine(967)-C(5))-methyltransferase RsmB n=1 Tax=Shewanella dokdonensis TaxID=712036 RepID=UPI00200BA8E6|nr:16S rRNA (cytosine(967)-C(5))-methyltransferase RsmB [Shewanella dokdonensis]MCL1076310.1 16S rRNA (cytosine(967)-C(5))-methyltransferase RsmB [Shewanella dokdonensis]
MNLRALAATAVYAVLEQGQSLSSALPTQQQALSNPKDKALLAELCYGVMRVLPQLDQCVSACLSKPFKGKQRIIHQLLLIGCYQLYFTRIPAHAAISETAEACRQLGHESLVKVVNGVLRNIQRQQPPLSEANSTLKYNFPAWIIKKLQAAYPEQWQQIIDNSQQRPPMWLRNNRQQQSREQYCQQLQEQAIAISVGSSDDAIMLQNPIDVAQLPAFNAGAVSVQDGAAQWAAQLLDAQTGELVLDACAAPGGKSCHILERTPGVQLVAVDNDSKRLARVSQNLQRLGLEAQVISGDAAAINTWWQGPKFDRILLDAPCSATGVIRRHPDIKWLRKAADITELSQLQAQILDHCWQWLRPGGILLYATCSIMPEENHQQIMAFLARTADAELQPITASQENCSLDWQILPGQDNMDGFYYAKLRKIDTA